MRVRGAYSLRKWSMDLRPTLPNESERGVSSEKSLTPVGAGRAEPHQWRALLMATAITLAPTVGVTAACQAVGVGRASFYRHARPPVARAPDHGNPGGQPAAPAVAA